jgi:cell division protein FtsI/penicillin-binding protein 2
MMHRFDPLERVAWLVLGLCAMFVLIALRCVYLQVVVADAHLERGDWSHQAHRSIRGGRGDLLDRNGHAMARSVLSATLAFDPRYFFTHDVRRRPGALLLLQELLGEVEGVDTELLHRWASGPPDQLPQFVVLARHMSVPRAEELTARLRERGIRALRWEPSYRRLYAWGDLAATTIGLASGDGGEGLSGLEATWNTWLQGQTTRVSVIRDSGRRAFQFEEPWELAAARGHTVVTTLDATLQRFAEDALQQTVQRYEAEAGVVIVSRVGTGEVHALATWPTFDLNRAFGTGDIQWSNPALSWTFEPGSTAKMLTFAAAFDAGLLRYHEPIDCGGGSARVGRFTIRDTHRMGTVPAWEVMQHSSNVGSLRIGRRLAPAQHRAYLEAFGFGRPWPLIGESAGGRLPRLPWAEATQATVSYGHGFSATPMHINVATATLANGGRLVEPRLVREIRRSDGTLVERFEPTVIRQVVSEQAARWTADAMATATVRPGTGTQSVPPGFTVAGKTGTSRLVGQGGYEMEYMSSFTGFVPADDPVFAITVMILRPNKTLGYYGGVVAAPLFREVAAQALRLEGIFPAGAERPHDLRQAPSAVGALEGLLSPGVVEALPGTGAQGALAPPASLRPLGAAAAGEGTETETLPLVQPADAPSLMPDVRGRWLSEAITILHAAGLEMTVHGSGRIARQQPPAWAGMPADGRVVLWLQTAVHEEDSTQGDDDHAP